MSSNPWNKLGIDDARRINSEGRFDFFWVVLETGIPGLMLKLSVASQPILRLPKLKNLVMSFRPVANGWAFVLGLKERSQIELFEILCRDVVDAGEAAESCDDSLARTIQRTQRWHHLLRGGRSGGLSVEEQQGLVGELAFLRELVSAFGEETAIESWTGPMGAAKDFEFIGCYIEVKTRRSTAKPFIAISSDKQLAATENSRLFLRVINIASAVLPKGMTLHDHVRITAELFEKNGYSFDIWEDALYSTGYDPENDYDGRCWQLGSVTDYQVIEGFPRIAPPLPVGVQDVRYSISLDACSPFELETDLIDSIRENLTYE
ncbi:PD-(D/E)XK motif protein [Xenorhabdus bovienii]|uniref:PD-(D/E)XK motif protein n=1 Tax=Xenorhabdus bovienii TaxID=40576 RepID=UPI0023B344CF|nr:PD-(D/E)XK motif protein [Xenorhabdus bovienii]MDE9457922.1 PD-(D/E)XK motif protein [Xenorhabdus bovienii]MDE9486197.1 PD-(D/E)XK motif protein [Xenorhabdus bovienii]MDE9513988.1 PD-(D/E)XK motif protein [Xenorhabdus bovienii]